MAVDLRPGARVVIVGMGVIGAEVAASAIKLGCDVTVVEPLAAPMERALGKRFGQWLGNEHRKRGVKTHFNRGVTGFKFANGRYWSDQFDLNIQFSGQIPVQAEIVVRGDIESNAFIAFFLSDKIIDGVLTVNRAADMGIGKRLVERRLSAGADRLGDTGVSLRELLQQAA